MLAKMTSIFFSGKKACQTKNFGPEMMKNGQHQHKDQPHTCEKSQDATTSAEDEIIILRARNLRGAHCNAPILSFFILHC
jgi:hypothetical protein